MSPSAKLREEIADDPGLSSAFPKLLFAISNLGPRAISVNAIELRFMALHPASLVPVRISMLLRGPADPPDLSNFPVRLVRREDNRLWLEVIGNEPADEVVKRMRMTFGRRIISVVVEGTAVPHAEFAKTETVDIRLDKQRLTYRIRSNMILTCTSP